MASNHIAYGIYPSLYFLFYRLVLKYFLIKRTISNVFKQHFIQCNFIYRWQLRLYASVRMGTSRRRMISELFYGRYLCAAGGQVLILLSAQGGGMRQNFFGGDIHAQRADIQ